MRRFLSILAVVVLAAPAAAEELTRGVSDFTVIQDGAGHARLLFKMAPVQLERAVIGRASVAFNTVGAGEARVIQLRAHPITTNWNPAQVSWTAGWSRPGGDFDEDIYSVLELDLSRGATSARIDLTPMLKEIVEGGMAADGFLLTVDPVEGVGLRVEDLPRFAGLSLGLEWRRARRVVLLSSFSTFRVGASTRSSTNSSLRAPITFAGMEGNTRGRAPPPGCTSRA